MTDIGYKLQKPIPTGSMTTLYSLLLQYANNFPVCLTSSYFLYLQYPENLDFMISLHELLISSVYTSTDLKLTIDY